AHEARPQDPRSAGLLARGGRRLRRPASRDRRARGRRRSAPRELRGGLVSMENPEERAWRAEFPITERLLYLNNCSLTPLHRRGEAALAEYARTWSELGGRAWFDHWLGVLEEVRAGFARVLGAYAEEIALEPAVTAALVTAASTFDYAMHPKVFTADSVFPTYGHTSVSLAYLGVEGGLVRTPDRINV